MVILTLLILGLIYCGKLPRYLCLTPWADVKKQGYLLPFYGIYCDTNVL